MRYDITFISDTYPTTLPVKNHYKFQVSYERRRNEDRLRSILRCSSQQSKLYHSLVLYELGHVTASRVKKKYLTTLPHC